MRTQKNLTILSLLAAAGASGCGQVHLGGSAKDTAPNEPLLASGSFSAGGVSGSALVYGQSGSYILRLVSFSAPSTSNLQAVVTGNGSTVATIALITNSGTKNYSFGAASGLTFNAVTIHSGTSGTDYAVATLQQASR
jgi:hypothetical protein